MAGLVYIRIFQLVATSLLLGLAGRLVAYNNYVGVRWSTSLMEYNYLLFTSCWTAMSLFYLLLQTFDDDPLAPRSHWFPGPAPLDEKPRTLLPGGPGRARAHLGVATAVEGLTLIFLLTACVVLGAFWAAGKEACGECCTGMRVAVGVLASDWVLFLLSIMVLMTEDRRMSKRMRQLEEIHKEYGQREPRIEIA